jgi:hypothetical protein
MSVSVVEISWLAGLLEGEGCFGFTNSGRTPSIWLSMTDIDVVEKVRNLVDPSRSINITDDKRKENYKTMYRLTLNGTRAIQWLMTIYSLMGVRRKAKIRELLDVWKSIEPVRSQVRDQKSRARQSLTFRLKRKNYGETAILMAQIFQAAGFSYEQILSKLKELESGGVNLEFTN